MRTGLLLVAVGAALGLLASGCSSDRATSGVTSAREASATATAAAHTTGTASPPTPPRTAPLRPGETMRQIAVPVPYTPKAPSGGTDDYRCFVLDPRLTTDSFVTGYDVVPGDVAEVHHAILYRVPPDKAALARARDAQTPGDGWTCFGGTGLEQQGASLDDAPWVGAWAPGGSERVLAPDLGIPLDRGSLLVLQVHYNLLRGSRPDRTAVNLRLSTSHRLTRLETMLFPAPVELPCRPGRTGPLCDRETAIFDVSSRFGAQAARTVAGLQLICNKTLEPKPGPTQSCRRTVNEPVTVRAVAGHMHLLGSSIRIVLNAGTPRARTLLDIAHWDFDNQGSIPVPATKVRPGDTVTVSCTHDQSWRDKLPALKGLPERYVVWGDGTTDEMCLGILSVTRP